MKSDLSNHCCSKKSKRLICSLNAVGMGWECSQDGLFHVRYRKMLLELGCIHTCGNC